MTGILYDPTEPAMCFRGHACAGEYGKDPVCAALSILMYTLLAALPAEGTQRRLGDGECLIRGGPAAAYEVVAAGLRLLAADYPAHVRMTEGAVPDGAEGRERG